MKSIILQTNDTAVSTDDQLGQIQFAASSESDGGAAVNVSARIEAVAEAAFQSATHATAIAFSTATSDANAPSEKIRISNNGYLGIGTTSPSYALHVNGDVGFTNEGFYASSTGVMLGVNGFLYNDGQTTLSHGRFSDNGDAQNSIYILRGTTTDANFTTIQNNVANVKLASNRSMMFTAHIIGRRTDTINDSTNENAAYILRGSIFNDGYGAAVVGSVSKTVIEETDSNWDVQATISGGGAGATDQINIQCKGASSKTVNWVIKLELLEVGGDVSGYTETNILGKIDTEEVP